MNSIRNIGRKGLADFISSMAIKDAHWYSIILYNNTDSFHALHDEAFPLLSKILNLDDAMFQVCLQTCGLLRFKKGTGYIPMVDAWRMFFEEYMLEEAEVTHFSPVNRKKRIYVRIGAWKYDRKTPGDIWAEAMKGNIISPKLRISSLGNQFARIIGEMGIDQIWEHDESTVSSESSESSEASEMEEVASNDTSQNDCHFQLPDATEFPLLHHLFSTKQGNHMDSLLREIILFHKEKSSITYRKGNNTDGAVIIAPSYRKLDKYYKDFSKPKNAVIDFVSHVASLTKSSIDEAAECILTSLLQHFEDPFYAAAVKHGVADGLRTKMDALSVEAMLTESRVQLSKARVMFLHMNHFFGRSLFESERKRRQYFGDNAFRPTVDKLVLEDKTVINFWYKLPDKLLAHQINEIVTFGDLLNKAEIVTGGDHGGGRF
jgi:hypothetical protein